MAPFGTRESVIVVEIPDGSSHVKGTLVDVQLEVRAGQLEAVGNDLGAADRRAN